MFPLFTQHLELIRILFSIAISSLAVLFISLTMAALGSRIVRLINYKAVPSFPLCIAYGLSFTVFLAYYANLAQISLIVVFSSVILVSFFLIISDVYWFIYNKQDTKKKITRRWLSPKSDSLTIIALSTAFFLCNVLTLKSSEVVPGGIGNNDIYFWAASTEQLLGRFSFANILPNGEEIWDKNLRPDSNGTYLAIGLFAVQFSRSAFEVLPLFMGSVIVWSGMVIADLIVLIFTIKRSISVVIALMVIVGPFFSYITYNYFVGQILSTFIFLALLQVSIVLCSSDEKDSYLNLVFKLFPLLSLLLISYQSGFLVFYCAFVFYGSIISINESITIWDAFYRVKKIVVSTMLALVFAFFCYPLVIVYLFHQTLYVSNVLAGWKVPFLGLFYLFNLPTPIPLSHTFQSNAVLGMVLVVVAISVMFFIIRKITRHNKRYKLQNIKMIWLSGIVFAIGVVGYMLAFVIKGDVYQVWKLASFTVMPISFIPISIFTLWLLGFLSLDVREQFENQYIGTGRQSIGGSHFPIMRVIIFGVVLILVGACLVISSYKSSGRSDLNVYNNFKNISGQLKGAKVVITDMPPYRDTLIAFNVFSQNYTIMSLSNGYQKAAKLKPSDIGPGTKWVTTSYCIDMLLDRKNQYKLPKDLKGPKNNDYLVFNDPSISGSTKIGIYMFGVGGGSCLLKSKFDLIKGLSGPESFGRWSDDKKVVLHYQVPEELQGSMIVLKFKISPFLHSGIAAQVVTPYLDGAEVQSTAFNKPGFLTINLSEKNTNKNIVELFFNISSPMRPSDLNDKSLDTRLLGVAFEYVMIEFIQKDILLPDVQ